MRNYKLNVFAAGACLVNIGQICRYTSLTSISQFHGKSYMISIGFATWFVGNICMAEVRLSEQTKGETSAWYSCTPPETRSQASLSCPSSKMLL